MRKRALGWWFAAVLTGVALFACNWAFARAGGGGGFSGGGGGFSGGGSGGGDGIGVLIYLLIRLVVAYPLIGIPVVIAVLYFVYVSSKGAQSAYVSSTIRRGVSAGQMIHAGAGLPDLMRRDPAFNLEAFFERCRNVLPAVQAAWSRQDVTPVRPFLSDGVFDRFSLQIEMQKGSGIRNDMQAVRVLGARLAGSASDRFFDTLHVALTAEAVDTTVALEGGRRLQGTGAPEPFTEVWTFLRRPGARTLARPGVMEGFCPNCGAPLELSTSVTCPSCKALVNSGEYDWVLAEITQAEVWMVPETGRIQGVEALLERDPGFNPQAVEDRVSAVFWHLRAAEFFGDAAYVRAVALPAFVEDVRRAWSPDAQGLHPFYADPAVGSVDLAEVMPGAGPEEMDRVRVRVQWSGHREIERTPGLFVPHWEASRLIQQEFVLARKSGVLSDQSTALTSRHCPGCGAPQEAKEDGCCRYCGLPQNDGSVSWVLESVGPFHGFATVAAPVQPEQVVAVTQLPVRVREAMIQCVAAIMLADGVIDPREEKLLRQMAAKQGVPPERLGPLIQEARRNGEVHLPQLDQADQRGVFFKLLVRMCLADGNVSAGERRLLRAMVERMGYGDVDIDMMIARERASLYAASKTVLKANRQNTSKSGVRPNGEGV